nr:hypothetical protein CFP56_05599 [Quercus suber]
MHVLDLLPCGVLIAVFLDGVPRLQDGADLRQRGQAVLEEAANHEGVGFRVEGVELEGDVGLQADDVELGLRYLYFVVFALLVLSGGEKAVAAGAFALT